MAVRTVPTEGFARAVRRAAYQAGLSLYGDTLEHRCADISVSCISARVQEGLDNDTDPMVIGLVDDYEYAFTMDHVGIEASGDAITDPKLHDRGYLMLYDPEYGISVLAVDMTTEMMYKMINDATTR